MKLATVTGSVAGGAAVPCHVVVVVVEKYLSFYIIVWEELKKHIILRLNLKNSQQWLLFFFDN